MKSGSRKKPLKKKATNKSELDEQIVNQIHLLLWDIDRMYRHLERLKHYIAKGR